MDRGPNLVRKLPPAVLVSIVAHAGLIAVAASYEPEDRALPLAEPVVVEIIEAPPPPAPVVVAMATAIDEPVSEVAPAPRPAAITATPRAAIETPSISAGSAAGAEPAATTEPTRSAYFDLRRGAPPRADLRLPATFLRDTPAAALPPEVRATGQLQESGGGTHRSEQSTFTAKVAADGSVTLKDRPNFHYGIRPPTPTSIAKGITQWYYSDKGPDGQRGERTLEKEISGSIDPGDRSKAVFVTIVRGGFDITDAFMRGKGIDPYASKKLAFLDSTRDERVQIGTQHRDRQLLQTSQLVQKALDRLWRSVPDAAGRRVALFELWDEVVETGDPRLVEAGVAARRLVVGAIRTRFPAGGPEAYSADELAALNRRRQSRTPFAPYE